MIYYWEVGVTSSFVYRADMVCFSESNPKNSPIHISN